MDWFFDTFMGTQLGIALAGAHYLWFSLPAWLILLVRLVSGKFTKREGLVLGSFCVFTLLEVIQLSADSSFFKHELWGMTRYFGVFAPFLWLWFAKALSELWAGDYPKFVPAPKVVCWVVGRLAVCAVFAWIFVTQGYEPISNELMHGAGRDSMVAARKIAKVIRRDYAGPARQAERKTSLKEYFTSRRPVVFGNFSAAAWALRGQSEGAVEGRRKSPCPYKDDYLFIRAGSGYGDLETVDAKTYDIIAKVSGLGTEWRLFRRKTTPHR